MPSSINETKKEEAYPTGDPDRKNLYSGEFQHTAPNHLVVGHFNDPASKVHATVTWNQGGAEFRRSLKLWANQTFTRRFWLAAIAGQFVSICITATNVETTELVNRGWAAPTTQTFFLYFILFLIYTPWTMYRYGLKAWARMILKDGWKYIILAAADVEGNYTVVKAYQYTDLLSAELLDAWAIPVCMFIVWILVKTRYHWTQYLGVIICVTGLGLLVASDHLTSKNIPGGNKPLGDGLIIVGATLYGVSNALQECLVRQRPLYEVVGQMGFWGTIINGVQAAGLEHGIWRDQVWNGHTIGMLVAYTATMFFLYTVAPILFRLASSPFYNLSILTSDFWGLIFGLGLYHYEAYWLYFIAYALTLTGLIVYFSASKPEAQAPNIVMARGKQGEREEAVRAKGGTVRIVGDGV